MANRMMFQSAHSWEEEAIFSIEDNGQLCISVAEELAVDSYNQMFTCSVHLSKSKMRVLRDWLSAMLENG